MTQRQAKIEALRIAVALVNAGVDWQEEDGEAKDIEKVQKQMYLIAKSLRLRAIKLGGEFNQYTGS